MARANKKLNKSVSAILAVILLVLALTFVLSLVIRGNDTQTVSPSVYRVGALDAKGEFVEDPQAIYTYEPIGCLGLNIVPDFEFRGTYEIYFYDMEQNFIERFIDLKGSYTEQHPFARYARIVVRPETPIDENPKEFKIDWYEASSFGGMLTVTIDKKQNYQYETVNLYDDSKSLYGKCFRTNNLEVSYLDLIDNSNTKVSDVISVTEGYAYYDVYLRFKEKCDFGSYNAISASHGTILFIKIGTSDMQPGIWYNTTLSVEDARKFAEENGYNNADHIRLCTDTDAEIYLFGYN